MRHTLSHALLALCAALPHSAHALTPVQLYAMVSPSVWKVSTYDADGLGLAQGSAVVIGPETLVTNCHVLAKAKRFVVRHEKLTLDGHLDQWDPQRDVCQIKVPGLRAPAVALGDSDAVQVGQEIFAIGHPRALDLTMSAGLASSLRRNEAGKLLLIGFSAPISHGSSGGGLFDESGALIGLTTLVFDNAQAQNLNFAVPVAWIKELPERFARNAKPAVGGADTTTAAVTAPQPVTAPEAQLPSARPEKPGAVLAELPFATEAMREQYRAYTLRPMPRAFVVSDTGRAFYAWSLVPSKPSLPTDPLERASLGCARQVGSGHCLPYAIDDRIVYQAPAH